MFKRLCVFASTAAILQSVQYAQGSQWNYTGTDAGLWNTPANWTLSGGATHLVPVLGDDATLGLALTVSNVTFNGSYSGAGLNSLTLDSPGHSSITLTQNSASTMIATTEYIGTTVSANTYAQSAGTNTTSTLYLGFGNGGFGAYNLSGTGALNAGTEFIGYAGTGGGSFTQSGGTNTVSSSLVIGQTGSNPNNAYNLSGGSISIGAGGGLYVGNAGKGAFTQSAGSVTLSGGSSAITVGTAAASTGNLYTLSGTGTISGANRLSVGLSGSGTFTQTGGTVSLGLAGNYFGNLAVGDGVGSTGIYNLSAATGAGSLTADNFYVGNSGAGTFNQTGGSLTANNSLNISASVNATGTFNLAAGSITVASNTSIGILGAATFTQTGGTVITGGLNVATGVSNSLANGNYSISAGSLTTGSVNVGFNTGAVGIVSQTGGTVNVTSAGTDILSLGTNAGGSGSYTIDASAGASVLNTTILRAGDGGTGTFTQNGGTVTVSSIMTVGRLGGSTGTYYLNSGTLNAGVNPSAANVFVGASGTGMMNQTGGAFTVGGGTNASLSLGASGGTGTYNLSGGSLVTPYLQPGNGGTGTFVQTGGTVNATQLNISTTAGSSGSYSLSGVAGVALGVSNFEAIGVSSSGTFTQSGGTHALGGDMQLGQNAAGSGTYNLSGGVLNVAANIGVGQAGSGFMNQTGGALNVTNGFYIGSGAGSNGNYQISSGTASIGTIYIGNSGSGTIYQNGGTLGVGTLFIGSQFSNTAATGTYTQTSGTLNVTNTAYLGIGGAASSYTLGGLGILNAPNSPNSFNDFFIGSKGTFTQYGGTVNGYVQNSGVFNFQGGTFNGSLENGANGTATFSSFVYFGSGLKNHGALDIAGGQVGTAAGQTFSNDGDITLSASGQIYSNGPVVNNGLITGTGSIGGSSTFVNNLSITQGAGPLTFSFAAGTAVNNGTVNLASGRALNLYGGFTNAGDFQVSGASIIQNGTLTNAATGTLSGPGTILAGFANSGVVSPGTGTLNIATGWTNTGIVQLGGITSNLTGGAITNTGTVQGLGNVGSSINNTSGVIEAIGGSLVIGGTLTNPAGGTLAAGTGGKIVVSGGLATNAGVVSLTGGTFDNNNHAMTNTGQISGFGVVRTGGAGLTNAGHITFTGGNTTVNGNVTNNAGQTIQISYNPATFTGNVINNGTFKTTTTTTTFAGTFTNNGIFTSDPATQNFGNLVISETGALQGTFGDVFNVSGDLENNSQQSTLWNTTAAKIAFTGTGAHSLTWTGLDLGANVTGYDRNFAIGDLSIAAGSSMTLLDGGAPGGALYVGALNLFGGVGQLDSFNSNGVNIYYDPSLATNAYLANLTYDLNGGGMLAPALNVVPEPGSVVLLGLGLSLVGVRRRRNNRG